MLTKVEVRSTLGNLLTLELADDSDGLLLENIEGLDPVKATLVSSSSATLDGARYQSSRRETRNIIITLTLQPDYITTSVRDLRRNLYNFFMPKSELGLRFFLEDDLVVDISGRVESFDSTLFAKDSKVTISLICYDPDFVELESLVVEENTVDDTTEFLIDYNGSVETGIIFRLLVDRTIDEFTIYHRPGDDQVRTLDFSTELLADDVLTINTNVGNKAVTLTRSSTDSSVLYGMSPQSNWIELLPGPNYIRVFAEGAAIPFTIEYLTRYGGL